MKISSVFLAFLENMNFNSNLGYAPVDDTVVRTGLKASIKAKAAAHKAHKADLKASLKAKIAAHKAQKKGYIPVDDTDERTGLKASITAEAADLKAQKKGL